MDVKNRLIIVEYYDPTTITNWQDPSTIKYEAATCQTVGYILEKTQKHLITFSQMNDLGQINDVTVIPAGCIIKTRYIKK